MVFAFCLSFLICTLIAALGLPLDCWRCVLMNCRRLDGSVSRNRVRREFLAFREYLLTFSVPAFLSFCVLFFLSTCLFTYIIPMDLMMRGISGFDGDSAVWRDNVADVRAEHTQFLTERGVEPGEIQKTQRLLWYGSPGLCCGFVFVCIGAVLFFFHFTRSGVTSLVTGIRRRRKRYARYDVSAMTHGASSTIRQSAAT